MVITIRPLLLILAFVCFIAAALKLSTRADLTAAGLALLAAAMLIPPA